MQPEVVTFVDTDSDTESVARADNTVAEPIDVVVSLFV